MHVIPYNASHAPGLAELYNRETAQISLCWPVEHDELHDAIGSWPGGKADVGERSTFVVEYAGTVHGFAVAGEHDRRGRGVIGFLLYERGSRRAGQMLLDEVHAAVGRRAGVSAFHQDHKLSIYHGNHAYCSDGLDHVQALLAVNGYAKDGGEIFLFWRDFDPPAPREIGVPLEISAEWRQGRGELPGLRLLGTLEGEKVAECVHVSAGEFSRREPAQRIAFCDWLGVESEYQGRGLGMHMLQRSLLFLHERGYRDAAISTAHDNHRAFLFYANCGYRVVDWTYGYRLEGSGQRRDD